MMERFYPWVAMVVLTVGLVVVVAASRPPDPDPALHRQLIDVSQRHEYLCTATVVFSGQIPEGMRAAAAEACR